MKMDHFFSRVLVGTVTGATLLLTACQPLQPITAPMTNVPVVERAAAVAHELAITATPEGYAVAMTVEAGWTTITLDNQSNTMRQATFLRFLEGKTMDDLITLMQSGEVEGLPTWLSPAGGPAGVLPGMSGSVTVNLPVGDYIVIDPVPDAEGVPGFAKGYLAPATVTEGTADTAPPAADFDLRLADYSFVVDERTITGGKQTIHLINDGPQEAHEIAIIKLMDGATLQEFMEAMAPGAPAGPPPGLPIGGVGPLALGGEAYLEVELEAGTTYGLVCFLPSTHQGGQPHFMLGMMQEITVP